MVLVSIKARTSVQRNDDLKIIKRYNDTLRSIRLSLFITIYLTDK